MKKYILWLFFAVSSSLTCFGDSPITSTYFCQAYFDIDIIREAEKSGIMTNNFAEFLSGDYPIEQKVALINALGWDINGKKNADFYENFLKKKYGKRRFSLSKCSADELLCFGYLKEMDDYFSTEAAIKILDLAVKKQPGSYTFHMIRGLVIAQRELDLDWCAAFEACNQVEQNAELKRDMKQEAVDIIWEYMSLYEDSCK